MRRRLRRVLLAVLGAALAGIGPGAARAEAVLIAQPAATDGVGELARLNQQILRAPNDPALNLQYAALAERLGLLRLALAAYERILIADPNNQAAQAGLDRVRQALQPATTQYFAETGYAWESNPRYTHVPTTHGQDQLFAALNVVDERPVDDMRWRTVGDASLHYYAGSLISDLDYARLGVTTGPVLQLSPGLTVNPGLGVAGAYFDHRWFYAEVAASAAFTAYPGGAEQALFLRGAYREYNHAILSGTQGGYADAIGKVTLPELFPDTAIVLSPWVRLSEIAGGVGPSIIPFKTDIQPGNYVDIGGKAQVYHSLNDQVILGASVAISGRFYQSEDVPASSSRRRDTTLSPGVQLILPHFLAYQSDLRFGYQYTRNYSNIPIDTYNDHTVSITLATRF